MNPNWERVRTIFHAVLEQPADARGRVLSEACEGDDATRREVESLLAAHGASDGFLESPPVAVAGTDSADAAPELQPGDRVGDFEVVGSLGAGGMGEVYRARDATLRRDVAIKLLPRALADDPQRLARFERESRILAGLNHPHIATIHSIEHADGLHALVMELVEGPTLADRLRRAPLPWRQALVFARELASALEAAHGRGVVHRDLKPANIKFTASGSVKLLDFGLAKEISEQEVTAAESSGPHGDVIKTIDGLIVGTCAYMSPEQARGQPVDKRTDIWAFGCLLFEMLAGKRAFDGDTISETMSAVLEREPNWTSLPDTTPGTIRRLLHRCLEKDPHRRLHDIADARIEIDDALQADDGVAPPSGVRRTRHRLVMLTSIAALVAAAAALGWWLRALVVDDRPTPRLARSAWPLPSGTGLSSAPAVSPDGQHLAFTATATGQPDARLFVRSFSALDGRPIAGTEGAQHPFWSPDGRSIAYFARGRLMRVAIDGGAPVEICAALAGRGGTWSRTGVIVFSPDLIYTGLSSVSADGGAVQPATLLDTAEGENAHRWPVFLPDGVHFLYFVRSIRAERRGVYLGRVDRPATTPGHPLFRSESDAQYVPLDDDRGVLLSAGNGRLELRPFDARRIVVAGDPTTVDVPAAGLGPYHAAMFSASADVLAYASSAVPYGQRFASLDRDGQRLSVREERELLNWPRLAPDGRRIAYQQLDGTAGSPDLWVHDLDRGPRLRVTGDNVAGMLPVWSPDGQRIAYLTGSFAKSTLVIGAADGSGRTVTVPCPGLRCEPNDWSRDGRWLLATVRSSSGADVWLLATEGGATSRPLLAESFVERDARFSHDGRLVAYVSQHTGPAEVSVQRIDGASSRDVISVGGGDQPVWVRTGRELFFVDPAGALRSVPVARGADGRPVFGKPVLVGVPPIGFGHTGTQYDVSPDGRRIYFFDRRREPPPSEIGIVFDWRALLR